MAFACAAPISQSTTTSGGGSGSTTSFPNMPAGYTVFEDNAWNTAPTTTTNASGWLNRDAADQGNLSVVADATAPVSANTVLQGKLPVGAGGGSSTYAIYRQFANASEFYPKLYFGLYFKLSSNFTNNGNTGTKFMWPCGDLVNQNDGSNTYSGFDGGNLQYQFFQQSSGNTGPDRRLDPNVNATAATLDSSRSVWHSLEAVLTANSANGVGDGTLSVWIDNTLTHQYTDVDWHMSPDRKWVSLRQEDTYGGGNNPVPADMYIWTDHLRIAGHV